MTLADGPPGYQCGDGDSSSFTFGWLQLNTTRMFLRRSCEIFPRRPCESVAVRTYHNNIVLWSVVTVVSSKLHTAYVIGL